VTLLSLKLLAEGPDSTRAIRFAIEDPVESVPITFDGCQSQSLDLHFEAVKFKDLRLIQPRPRLIEPACAYVGGGRPGKIEWTWLQPRRLILYVGRTLGLAEFTQRVRQVRMEDTSRGKSSIARTRTE